MNTISGTTIPAPPGTMASTEHVTATAGDLDVVDALWPHRPVGVTWHVMCERRISPRVFRSLAAAEEYAIGTRCPSRHTITLVKLGAPS